MIPAYTVELVDHEGREVARAVVGSFDRPVELANWTGRRIAAQIILREHGREIYRTDLMRTVDVGDTVTITPGQVDAANGALPIPGLHFSTV